jgi:hypothetical protein
MRAIQTSQRDGPGPQHLARLGAAAGGKRFYYLGLAGAVSLAGMTVFALNRLRRGCGPRDGYGLAVTEMGGEGKARQSLLRRLQRTGTTTGRRQGRSSREFHDLDSLAGTWSEEMTQEFAAVTADFRKPDPNLWE